MLAFPNFLHAAQRYGTVSPLRWDTNNTCTQSINAHIQIRGIDFEAGAHTSRFFAQQPAKEPFQTELTAYEPYVGVFSFHGSNTSSHPYNFENYPFYIHHIAPFIIYNGMIFSGNQQADGSFQPLSATFAALADYPGVLDVVLHISFHPTLTPQPAVVGYRLNLPLNNSREDGQWSFELWDNSQVFVNSTFILHDYACLVYYYPTYSHVVNAFGKIHLGTTNLPNLPNLPSLQGTLDSNNRWRFLFVVVR
ncbi:MAG: hypothetical protein OXC44_06030 [Proteobacteria bacterium]|nr:hypothetical protein [Pseudomonadota bacterium]